jgi:hypothetical protein
MSRLRSALVRSACLLGLLCLLVGACRTNNPDAASQAADEDTTVADAAPGDTSTAATDSVDRPTPPPPAPAPGTARVRVEIVSCDGATEPVRCQVRVTKVLGYGSATPPLSTGERTMRLADALLADRDVTTLEGSGPHTVVARHAGDRPSVGEVAGEDRPEWTVQSIEQ